LEAAKAPVVALRPTTASFPTPLAFTPGRTGQLEKSPPHRVIARVRAVREGPGHIRGGVRADERLEAGGGEERGRDLGAFLVAASEGDSRSREKRAELDSTPTLDTASPEYSNRR
jgi:hypothetical protein